VRFTPSHGGRRLVALSAATVVVAPLAFGATVANAAPQIGDGEQKTYIVQLKDKPIAAYDGGIRGYAATKPGTGQKVDTGASAARSYAKYLDTQRDRTLDAIGVDADRLVAEYDVAFNGMAVKLTESELYHLKKLDSVVNVWEDEIRYADTVQTPDYLGLTGPNGVWDTEFGGPDNAGEGIVVGVIDTGIDPNNPSFAPEGIPAPPETFTGTCDFGTDDWGTFECNNKIVGARFYGSEFGNTTAYDYLSARDMNGHGSHTAGTAAGNDGVPLQINGISLGEASGMAPQAHIAVYKALWMTASGTGSGTSAGLVAAIDQAVEDGVDVINYSISGSREYVVTADEVAFLIAAQAGIFVATSAGNEGDTDGPSSVAHNAPWTTTVAASTHNRGADMTVTVGGDGVERWYGDDRYATAAAIADEYVAPVEKVYISTGRDFADALTAAAGVAGGLGAAEGLWNDSPTPVLLTQPTALPQPTIDALEKLQPSQVVILGGPVAVGQSVEDQLVAAGYDVTRIQGKDRYATAAKLAMEHDPATTDTVYVATGMRDSFADALSGGPLASRDNAPILLTKKDGVPAVTLQAIEYLEPENIVVLGGPVAVSDAAYAALGATARIYGETRYETSAAIAAEFGENLDLTLVASGADYPDALTGAAFAGSRGVPVVLTRPETLPDAAAAELGRLNPARVALLGGPVAVGTAVEDELLTMFPGEDAQTFEGVGNGSGVFGELVDAADIPAEGFTGAQSSLCLLGSVDDAAAAGKIVICTRGENARVEKSQEVFESGGIGMVQANNTDAESLNADFHSVPSIHLNGTDGTAVKAYAEESARPVARISDQSTDPVDAPEMAGFSSYGPALAGGGDLLKPDITAPGVDIAAAYHGDHDDPNQPTFNQISGTSMSAPHIAGLAALMKQAYPDWSPMAIKSAMMTTARDTMDSGQPIQRSGADATPLDYGAGEVRPGLAYNPGLVYDSDIIDWAAYACAIDQWELAFSAPTCAELPDIDASDLNYPSIAIGDLAGTQTVTRTVTDVTGEGGTYTFDIEAPEGTDVTVSPEVLEVPAGGSASYEVTISVTSAPAGQYTFGQLRLVNGDIVVESPIAVQPAEVAFPDEVSGEGVEGTQGYTVTTGYEGDLELGVRGLVASDVHVIEPVSDGEQGGGTVIDAVEPFTVPEGTTTLRVSIFDSEIGTDGTDMDLYLANSAGQLFAVSGSEGSDESITIDAPEPGNYYIVIDYWDAPAGATTTVPTHVWAVPSDDEGNLTVDPTSATATIGGTVDVTVDWTGLNPGDRYLGAVTYSNGTDALGRTLVSVTTGAPALN